MRLASTAQDRSTVAARTAPPWLWAWMVGYLIATIPLQVSLLRYAIGTFFGPNGEAVRELFGSGLITWELLAIIFSLLNYVIVLTGAVTALLPHLRGRWVERRFKLASDDRSIVAEMQQFVNSYDPLISLRVTIQSGQMARLYPVGWRRARIAIFRPLPALWRRDREAAEAILLHEVGHRRQGDQLIVGVGSPFVALMRIWVVSSVLLVIIPGAVFVAIGGSVLAPFLVSFGLGEIAPVPGMILVPVTALWLAELEADQWAARALGPDAVRRALKATEMASASPVARMLTFLSHPPRRMRQRLVTARPSAGFVVAWPIAVVLWLLVLPFVVTVPSLFLLGLPSGLLEAGLKVGLHELFADSRPLVITTAVLLIAWPVLAVPWERWWSSAPGPAHPPRWLPYLAAAIVPVALLGASLVPIRSSLPGVNSLPTGTSTFPPGGACGASLSWERGAGGAAENTVEMDSEQLLPVGATSISPAAAQEMDVAIRAALANPPPGNARPSYTQALTDYENAVTDLQQGKVEVAANEMTNGTDKFISADELLIDDC